MKLFKRSNMIVIFCVIAALQIWVPLSMIARREATLKNGAAYKFLARPVDPYDAFRGRYIALNYENSFGSSTNATMFRRGQTVYVAVETGTNGYARLGVVTPRRPSEGDYIRTKANGWRNVSNLVSVTLPFDRFYLNEKLAPDVEIAYRKASMRERRKAYALVRIRSGMAVIENLYIENKPIMEFLESERK